MFSKVLLLLAVCFQGLRTGNSAISKKNLPDVWQKGETVTVKITTHKHEHTNCKIEFQDEKGDSGDCLLVSFDGATRFVINTYIDGKWNREDNYKIIDNNLPRYMVKVAVMAREKNFRVAFERRWFYRDYEFPLENIKQIKVECPNEDSISVNTEWSQE